jgi:hypothetical protein
MSTELCQPRRAVSNFWWQRHQLQQLHPAVYKLQLRSWKILEGSCGYESIRHFAQKIPLSAAKICENI